MSAGVKKNKKRLSNKHQILNSKQKRAGGTLPGHSLYSIQYKEFLKKATPLSGNVEGTYITLQPKMFSQSSFGYLGESVVPFSIGNQKASAQLNAKVTISNIH
jgi:hypothetical protein